MEAMSRLMHLKHHMNDIRIISFLSFSYLILLGTNVSDRCTCRSVRTIFYQPYKVQIRKVRNKVSLWIFFPTASLVTEHGLTHAMPIFG